MIHIFFEEQLKYDKILTNLVKGKFDIALLFYTRDKITKNLNRNIYLCLKVEFFFQNMLKKNLSL